MTFNKIDRNTVYKQVANQIRDAILSGRLAPGEPLPPEREMTESFGVSRTSIREALRSLQAEGLVESGGRTSPPRVAEASSGPLRHALHNLLRLNGISLRDLVELRCAVECAAVNMAASRADERWLGQASSILEEMLALEDLDLARYDDADVRFHLALARASANSAMYFVMLAVRDSIAHHFLNALKTFDDPLHEMNKLTQQHTAILDAVKDGNGSLAAQLMDDHITGFYSSFVSAQDEIDTPKTTALLN